MVTENAGVNKINLKTLTIPGVRESLTVPANQIIRIEAASNYSRIYFANGKKLLTSKVLHWFQDLLPQEMFVRVHRSHLVNRDFVENIKVKGGSQTIIFFNGEAIPVSRRNRITAVGLRQKYL